jgi:hypothetical protein
MQGIEFSNLNVEIHTANDNPPVEVFPDNLALTLSHMGMFVTVYYGRDDTQEAYIEAVFDD